MAKGEEPLSLSGVNVVRMIVPEKDAMAGGVAMTVAGSDDVEVGPGEPLLPLQDPWYCSSLLFPAVGALEVSPPMAPKRWILKGETPSPKATWVPVAIGILDLRFQQKEFLPAPIQSLCPCGITSGWSNWVEQEVAEEGFCQILRGARIFEAVVLSRGWNMYRDVRALRFMVRCWHTDTHTFFFPWGETTVTLEDVERICLLPIMGDVNPLELELFDAKSEIASKLLETFGGTSATWGGNRTRFSF